MSWERLPRAWWLKVENISFGGGVSSDRPGYVRLKALAVGLMALAAVLAAPAASDGYIRFTCGGHGYSSLLSTTSDRDETLLVWEKGQESQDGFCESTIAEAAVGSTSSGFGALGMISNTGKLSYATGVSLDEAGDGWVIGLHEAYSGSNRYGPHFEPSGAWAAFRPAGSGFHAPVELPFKGEPPSAAWVAGNRAGRTLLAWSTPDGSYLSLATNAGVVSKPTFIGRGFQVSAVGVAESGRAVVVGYYGSKSFEAIKIAAVTTNASGSFSRPQVLVNRPRNVSKHLIGHFEQPIAAVGPRGNAVIAWETDWVERRSEEEFSGPNELMYLQANGHFDKPVRLASRFLDSPGEGAVDHTGGAVVISANVDHGLREDTVSPGGRVGQERKLWGFVDEVSMAGNEFGRIAIGWVDGAQRLGVIVGNIKGVDDKPQLITTPHEVGLELTVAMNAQGVATVFWVEKPAKDQTILYAQSITPGAQPVEIASSEPSTS